MAVVGQRDFADHSAYRIVFGAIDYVLMIEHAQGDYQVACL